MKKSASLLLAIFLMACAKDTSNFTLKGHIKDLKKGTVYLQRMQDSTFVTMDSIVINGTPEFELHAELESPEMLYLKLHKHDHQEHMVPFFADTGITEITSNLKNFDFETTVKGSKQQEQYEEYMKMMSRFNEQNLELIKANFDAQKDNDTTKLNATVKNYNSLIKRKYLYTVNFAINHKDSDIAPYLVLTEIHDANLTYLDTVNKVLSPKVKSSKYGRELQTLIDQRKSVQ